MAFERYVPKKAAKPEKKKTPVAVIKPSGYLSFGAETLQELGATEASHAVLYCDAPKKRIGVHFTNDAAEEGALKVTRRGSTVGVKAPGFFEDFRFVIEKTAKCPVRLDRKTGYVLVDAKAIPRRRGRKKA